VWVVRRTHKGKSDYMAQTTWTNYAVKAIYFETYIDAWYWLKENRELAPGVLEIVQVGKA